MYTIAIVGAGQLGSRHLQGLKSARLPMCIYVMDQSEESLAVAKSRYDELPENPSIESIHYVTSIDALPDHLDLVVVATGSAPRRAVVEELLAKKKVNNLVLEKVLFQSLSDYPAVAELLDRHGLLHRTWVNCPRRMYGGYARLAQQTRKARRLAFEATGNAWGMACNAIHIIDLFAMLKGDAQLNPISTQALEPQIYPSKREGYVEFMGSIEATTPRGDTMRISCLDGDPTGFFIRIETEDGTVYQIDETADTATENGAPWGAIEMKYQSGLTGELAEKILSGRGSSLASFEESAELHQAFLKAVAPFYNTLTEKQGDSCPIT